MKKITIVWTIVLVLIVGGLTFVGYQIKKNNVDNIMEKSLVTQTEKYLGLYPSLYPTKGNTIKLTYEELKDNGYDANLNEDCNGYVIIENASMGYKYKAYVKCSNYVTKGYEENK